MDPVLQRKLEDHFRATEQLSTQIEGVEGKVDKMEGTLKKIETLLIGDGQFIKNGMVQKLDNLEKKTNRLESDRNKLVGGAAASGAILGALMGFLTEFFRS